MSRVLLIAAFLILCPQTLVFTAPPPGSQSVSKPPAHVAASGGNTTTTKKASSAADKKNRSEAEIRAMLDEQVAAWNHGDIEGFMKGYWQSDQTTFAHSNGLSRGWQALLDRYRRHYPDRAAMGRLEFSDLEVTLLSRNAALILGHWQLERQSDRPSGIFTLVARRFPEGWRILHDHTSGIAIAPAKH